VSGTAIAPAENARAADSSPTTERRPGWVTALVFALVAMIVWTVVIKYLVPLTWFWSERLAGRAPASAPVMWDFWPLLHVVLAWGLWRRARWIWPYALAVALVESAVVIAKFIGFFRAPELSLWRLLWFTNKIYVLALFLCLTALLLGPGRRTLRRDGEGWA
jgi:hypothetical protein